MGQRANYIVKEGDKLTIHYNHWRANCIASDLYLGERRFLNFVNECQVDNEIMTELWIEGCVIIDISRRQLFFWSYEFRNDTSLNEYYLKQLVKKWPGWNLERLKNRMYDVEKILSIDYISKQEKPEFCSKSKEEIVNDKIEKFEATLIVIKQSDRIFIKRTAYIPVESIIDYGEEVIQLLLDKPEYALPMEEEAYPCECIIIDTVQRHIIIDSSKFGLWEQNAMKWNDYNFTMGDYGRIETLKLAGLDVANLEMPMDKIREQFKGLVRQVDGFDPSKWANKLLKENNDIQFNPDFFDSVRPQKTSLEKMKERIKKILRVK